MSVRIHFLGEAQPAQAGEPVVLAPRAALRQEGGAAYVWVVTAARCAASPSRPAPRWASASVVAEGLLGGEALVVGDAEGLAEGRAVEVGGGG